MPITYPGLEKNPPGIYKEPSNTHKLLYFLLGSPEEQTMLQPLAALPEDKIIKPARTILKRMRDKFLIEAEEKIKEENIPEHLGNFIKEYVKSPKFHGGNLIKWDWNTRREIGHEIKEAVTRTARPGEPSGMSTTIRPEKAYEFANSAEQGDYLYEVVSKVSPKELLIPWASRKDSRELFTSYRQTIKKILPDKQDEIIEEIERTIERQNEYWDWILKKFDGPEELSDEGIHTLSLTAGYKPFKEGLSKKEIIEEAKKRIINNKESVPGFVTNDVVHNLLNKLPGELTGKFNDELKNNLLKRGYKGIIHSPIRYNEWEILYFQPDKDLMLSKVLHKDKLTAGVEKYTIQKDKQLKESKIKVFGKEPKKESLGNIYKERMEKLGNKVYRRKVIKF